MSDLRRGTDTAKTPRCDAVAKTYSFKNQTHQQTADEATAFEELARQLERELNDLRAARDEARDRFSAHGKICKGENYL